MNVDFKKLNFDDRVKAIKNLLKFTNNDLNFLSYVIANGAESHDVYGWFQIDQSNEGSEYWYNIKVEQQKSK